MEQNSLYLSQEQAEQRYSQIVQGSIVYKLQLNLQKGKNFSGQIQIFFQTNHIDTDTFLDFNNTSIDSVNLNGQDIDIKWDKLFLILPKQYLNIRQNQVFINFSCKYTDDGSGLHSFIDTDGKQYLYSQCETYFANRIYPNFDQPDLKAYLELKVIAPSDWRVLSNEKPISQKIDHKTYKLTFPKTKLLPTYLFAIIAGPYYEIAYEKPYRIPMSLFCRESLFEHLKNISEFMFEVTIKSMETYEQFFGYDFPFNKYDQIFCAEYNWGAMENAGIVTFNDIYVYKEEVVSAKYTWLANVVAHELAHHWFGNLVTMKWWNDLWLNESFADFISHFCISKFEIKSKQIQDIWVAFNQRKDWGYKSDQQITTHPIAGEVKNTQAADNIFDGITYAKGSATMKQLLCLVGEESFSNAMSKYFHQYAFQNATLNEFITNLDMEFLKLNLGFTLEEWKDQWICKAGLNECEVLFDPSNKSQKVNLTIVQTPAMQEYPTLRYHKLQIGLIQSNGNIIPQQVLLNPKKETTITYDGSKNIVAILPNYKDESFIKILLDKHSLQFFQNNLNLIKDDLSKTLVWKAFKAMVNDGKLSVKQYVDIFITQIPLETDGDIISNQLSTITQLVNQFTPLEYKPDLYGKLFKFTYNYLQNIDIANKSLVISVKSNLVALAYNIEDVKTLLKWYNNEEPLLQKFELGLELQWKIVSLIHKYKEWSNEEKQKIFNQQALRDPSDTQKNMQVKCQALKANPEERQQLWNKYIDKNEDTSSLRMNEYSWAGFNNSIYINELEIYWDKWFEVLPKIYQERNIDFAKTFTIYLQPKSEDFEKLYSQYNQLIQNADKKQIAMIKKLKEFQDDLKKVEKAFKCYRENL